MENPKTEFTSHDIDVMMTKGQFGYIIRILCEQNHPALVQLFPKVTFEHINHDTQLVINERQLQRLADSLSRSRFNSTLGGWLGVGLGIIFTVFGLTELWNFITSPQDMKIMYVFFCLLLPVGIAFLWGNFSILKATTKPDFGMWCEQK